MQYFFFQAEDGIRDGTVTGVQTCALPISPSRRTSSCAMTTRPSAPSCSDSMEPPRSRSALRRCFATQRSEERRVGKECRSQWSAYYYKKKNDRYEEKSNEKDDAKRGMKHK